MAKETVETAETEEVKTKSNEMGLSEEERNFIESQRKEAKRLEEFRARYDSLVKETGFAWAVDGNSTLNSPKIGIAKVN